MESILAITPFFGRSGSEIALFNLCEGLNQVFDISIYTPQLDPDLKQDVSDKIKVYHSGKRSKRKSFIGKLKKALNPTTDFEKRLGNKKFDYIILNTFLSFKYFDLFRSGGTKVILYVHETEQMLSGIDSQKFNKILAEADLVFCSSNHVKQYLNLLGRQEKIKVLYPAVNFEKFSLPLAQRSIRKELGFGEKDFVWGMSGALTLNKNPAMFIAAAEILLQRFENVKFLWIGTRGNDIYEEYLIKSVKKKGLQEKVQFIEKREDDYFEYLNILNGYLLTSFSESFSLSAMEAASFNIPVISFPCGGVLEAVPDKLRQVTSEFSTRELVEKMESIMENGISSITLKETEQFLRMDKKNAANEFRKVLREEFKVADCREIIV
ncbi:Glycosyltransferase involved in cell wall bisynthesis [Salinimicrobium catena]|uniref:Glycosyltransferase involved in cell wall bisynthesis n=1 Tax=Salinimicrobium catena TaxID=390640 RepID=A0A1H5NBB4_9FLAO|nr:glycosyltransferase family 4 protein [Salinimicrobium catena]SDL41618.1 Glycosyltransferase involved in cell wall bisynthesis [Salinimicrobium catena]SEE98760.1 Glycosyltransferase involved in cell wall bisynthesis [Salinimicrobium catena]